MQLLGFYYCLKCRKHSFTDKHLHCFNLLICGCSELLCKRWVFTTILWGVCFSISFELKLPNSFLWRRCGQVNLSGSRPHCTLPLESHRNQDFSGNDNQMALKLWFHVRIKLGKKQKLEIISSITKFLWLHIAWYSFKPLTSTSWKKKSPLFYGKNFSGLTLHCCVEYHLQSAVKILRSIELTCCINMEQDLSSALRRGIKIKCSFYILLKSLTTADI